MDNFDRDMTLCIAVACATLLAVVYLGHRLVGALAYPIPGI